MDWVADHRKHHAHADKEGDPHSPHVVHGSGLRGLWHAHTGWLLETQGQADWKQYARELYEDHRMRRIGRRFPLLVLVSLALPTLAGFVLHGFTLGGALRGYIWGALVRIFIVHHVTWSVNSICHFSGVGASTSRTVQPTSRGCLWSRSASPGITIITPSRAPPTTACGGGRSTLGAGYFCAGAGRARVERHTDHTRTAAPKDERSDRRPVDGPHDDRPARRYRRRWCGRRGGEGP
jgi:Fatty acid desaturase